MKRTSCSVPAEGSRSASFSTLTSAIFSSCEQGFILKFPPTKNGRGMVEKLVEEEEAARPKSIEFSFRMRSVPTLSLIYEAIWPLMSSIIFPTWILHVRVLLQLDNIFSFLRPFLPIQWEYLAAG